MNKISCDVCMDLMPLVKDCVASEESIKLVEKHIKECECCRNEYDNVTAIKNTDVNDKKIVRQIKRNLIFLLIGILLIGSILGIALSYSFGMFYNFILMPVLGGVGYLVLSKRWYYIPLWIFILSYIWLFISGFIEGMQYYTSPIFFIISPLFLSFIYTGLSIIGIIITRLLKFAFKKEV
ncbi:MAG TPA: hypothetical protein DC000_08070 [Clostridiales bacterium]|nr:hypothetical protein [Clostridiales bacterium]